jgi:hypothetical protein
MDIAFRKAGPSTANSVRPSSVRGSKPKRVIWSQDRSRRFPPPWSVEDTDACFIVRDANGQALAYCNFI